MIKKFCTALLIGTIALLTGACQKTENTTTSDQPAATTSTAPDNSQVVTTTDKNGMKTQTRTFSGNPRVSKVVVTTTREGKRTVKVYSPSGEEREVKNGSSDPLTATGNAIADGAGFVADKSETAVDKTKEAAKPVVEKTGETAKQVGQKTVDTSKTVANKAAAQTKSVGSTVTNKAKEGVQKTGKALKKVVP
jgi:hypothetical protein